MALTKLDYLRIAERVEAMYMNCSTQLILNIVRHLASGKGLSTAEWQLKKLSEMQSLTRESMEIIAANTGKRREAVEQAFREVFGIGLADTEKVLQAAVKAGKLVPVPSVEDSEAMRQLLQAYIGQADDTLNLVNTVMLDSTLNRYRLAVQQVTTEAQQEAVRILERLGANSGNELATKLAYTQNVLNTQSTGVVTGAVARQKAVRDAIKDLASKGITGFVDAGWHHWTPEAYVNMDIRTTAHNVAIEAQKQRSAEYGVQTFQISTHAGARPLCAPYQGWICSWDNGGGTVTDLYGKEYQVHGINETSYGEAAGIFGINCGHFPETFVDGFSVPRYEELTPEQEKQNEIEYAQSQQQRELEREIRQAKTEAAAYSAAGDKEAFQKAAAKVKEKQTDYKQFCEQTGRTPRPDRTQVSTYSRSEASKVSWANRKNPTEPKPPRDFTPKKDGFGSIGFRNANTDGIEKEQLANLTARLTELEKTFGIIKDGRYAFNAVNEDSRTVAYVNQDWFNDNPSLCVNTKYYGKSVDSLIDIERREQRIGGSMPCSEDMLKYYSITHEYGHMIEDTIIIRRYPVADADAFVAKRKEQWERFGIWSNEKEKESRDLHFARYVNSSMSDIRQELISIAKSIDPKATIKRDMSTYGQSKPEEFFAEAFANAYCGLPNVFGKAMMKWLAKEGLL